MNLERGRIFETHGCFFNLHNMIANDDDGPYDDDSPRTNEC